jgi:lipid II:glycine glycyltransferase (peptidoglycan interpeptide bridge formation enzyme)
VGNLARDIPLNIDLAVRDKRNVTFAVELSDQLPDQEWDNFLAHTHGGSHFQTSRWAEVKLEPGWQVLRAKVHSCDEVLGGAQILLRRIPFLGRIGFISRGPVISHAHREVLTPLLDALCKAARQYRIQYLLLQPPCGEDWLEDRLNEKGFLRSIVSVAPEANVLIDLTPGEKVLLKRMTPRVQRYIRSAMRKGINIREGKEVDIPVFLHLLRTTAHAKGWLIFSDGYYHNLWKTLHPTKNVRLTIARWGDKDIAALLVYAHGERVYGKTLVRTGQHDNSGAHELLIWESIRWAKSSGHRIYDLSRIKPGLGEKYLLGLITINQVMGDPAFSKLKFGGEVVLCPQAYAYLYNPMIRSAYRLISPVIQNVPLVQQLARSLRGLRRRMKSNLNPDQK